MEVIFERSFWWSTLSKAFEKSSKAASNLLSLARNWATFCTRSRSTSTVGPRSTNKTKMYHIKNPLIVDTHNRSIIKCPRYEQIYGINWFHNNNTCHQVDSEQEIGLADLNTDTQFGSFLSELHCPRALKTSFFLFWWGASTPAAG